LRKGKKDFLDKKGMPPTGRGVLGKNASHIESERKEGEEKNWGGIGEERHQGYPPHYLRSLTKWNSTFLLPVRANTGG